MACLECGDDRVVHLDDFTGRDFWDLLPPGNGESVEVRFCPFCGVNLAAFNDTARALWGIERFAEWLGRERLLEKAREAKRLESAKAWDAIWNGWADTRVNYVTPSMGEWHFIRTGWRLP